jgi:glycerophosphoryl diester phosphodiesterase
MKEPLIIAHRGFSTRWRENSPAAWRAAIAAGTDLIEVDLRATRDGAVVCHHDADLSRLAGRTETVADCTAAMLAALDAGGEPLAPTLADLFSVAPAGTGLLFDMKDETDATLATVMDTVGKDGRDGIVLGLHEVATVAHVRASGWTGRILGFLSDPDEATAFFAAGGDVFRLWERDADFARLMAACDAGWPIWIMTGGVGTDRATGIFDPSALRRMAEAGAKGLLVNDPAAARDVLETAG